MKIQKFCIVKNTRVLLFIKNCEDFDDKKYPLIGNIDKTYLKTSKNNFVSQVYMLCKIQKKIEKGNSVCLDEIFEDRRKTTVFEYEHYIDGLGKIIFPEQENTKKTKKKKEERER